MLWRTLPAIAVLLTFLSTATGQSPKDAGGYWQLMEVVRVEYPKEKVHKIYPVDYTLSGNQLIAVAKTLNGNDPRVIHTEEHQTWTWTPPPSVLVPGEKIPMKFELKLERTKQTKPPEAYIGGWMNAGFMPPKPKDAAAFHVGADTQTDKGEKGGLDPRNHPQTLPGAKFPPGTYNRESFVVVPPRQNRLTTKEHPDQISFRVGGCIGSTREYNTIYEYKWVEGMPPANRGGSAMGTPTPPPATGGSGAAGSGAGGKWEYKVLDVSLTEVFGPQFERRLTDLGNEGWELVGVTIAPPPPNASVTTARLIFKRQKK